ncbi:MAG: glycosyltransferase family 2 protein [Planctomycetota bacterium]|nr:MAG: glycosyltransferase family 2 protein [Planctomycetota bacterium]REJ94108.1 MAG: glycosyltransferase family 2 protein [Planctomycetota bacterium]
MPHEATQQEATGPRFLVALPVYNERRHVDDVLNEVFKYSKDVLVVDDGSDDGTAEVLSARRDILIIRHPENRGYGAALVTAFEAAVRMGYDVLVTIDCDGQHEPQRIPDFVAACRDADIVSGSRYLQQFAGDSAPPEERRRINMQVTAELNRRLCLELTDAFCGFKAYRVEALAKLHIDEPGYAMPLQVWVEAARSGLKVIELPVPLIYLEEKRSFGGALDDGQTRMEYYHMVLDRNIAAAQAAFGSSSDQTPSDTGTLCGECAE